MWYLPYSCRRALANTISKNVGIYKTHIFNLLILTRHKETEESTLYSSPPAKCSSFAECIRSQYIIYFLWFKGHAFSDICQQHGICFPHESFPFSLCTLKREIGDGLLKKKKLHLFIESLNLIRSIILKKLHGNSPKRLIHIDPMLD